MVAFSASYRTICSGGGGGGGVGDGLGDGEPVGVDSGAVVEPLGETFGGVTRFALGDGEATGVGAVAVVAGGSLGVAAMAAGHHGKASCQVADGPSVLLAM